MWKFPVFFLPFPQLNIVRLRMHLLIVDSLLPSPGGGERGPRHEDRRQLLDALRPRGQDGGGRGRQQGSRGRRHGAQRYAGMLENISKKLEVKIPKEY